MKNFTLALLVVCILATSGYAQSSLFGQFDIISTNWAKLPSGGTWDAPSVATDGKGTVAVLIRQAPHFRFFKSDGTFIKAWGYDDNTNYHSIYFGPDGAAWLAATNNHVMMKFSPDGELLMTLGKRGVTGDNASKEAFNQPNAVAFGKNGEIFVSDGYVNSRIVEFTKEGQFVRIIGASKEAGRANLTFRMPWPLIPVVVSLLRIAATSEFASLIRTANSSKPGRLPDREDWLLVPTAPSTSVTLTPAQLSY